MRVAADHTVEIDLCSECGGFFLDAGEGDALTAVEKAPKSTFAPPPRMSDEDIAIFDQRRETPSFFARFVLDFVSKKG